MSTEKTTENNILLARLIFALDSLNLPKYGRTALIANKTGYSANQAGLLLTGKKPLNTRFIKSICSNYNIEEDWVMKGEGEVLSGQPGSVAEPAAEYEIRDADHNVVLSLRGITPTQKLILEEVLKVPRERAADLIDYLRDQADADQRRT
jgi:hypothetical protein